MRRLAALCAVVVAVGCASAPKPPPQTIEYNEMPKLNRVPAPEYTSDGSLFNATGSAALINDFRARHRGDVLFVNITESSLASSSADNSLKKDSNISLRAPVVFGWENKLKEALGPDFDPALALSASTSKSFEGEGETTRQGSLIARLAVRVIAVGPDGRMVVIGSKKITVNRETETLTLAGIVRPEDVGPNNSLNSTAIADLTIKYGGDGDVDSATKQGWLHRLVAKVWPF